MMGMRVLLTRWLQTGMSLLLSLSPFELIVGSMVLILLWMLEIHEHQ